MPCCGIASSGPSVSSPPARVAPLTMASCSSALISSLRSMTLPSSAALLLLSSGPVSSGTSSPSSSCLFRTNLARSTALFLNSFCTCTSASMASPILKAILVSLASPPRTTARMVASCARMTASFSGCNEHRYGPYTFCPVCFCLVPCSLPFRKSLCSAAIRFRRGWYHRRSWRWTAVRDPKSFRERASSMIFSILRTDSCCDSHSSQIWTSSRDDPSGGGLAGSKSANISAICLLCGVASASPSRCRCITVADSDLPPLPEPLPSNRSNASDSSARSWAKPDSANRRTSSSSMSIIPW
mmetsp:Transcript_22350/g.64158  ORF Transcript_22350/g.64158 Transcript_22350/m.64158 type:complete len:299 (+) Transcript_22350:740-1636(+)